LTKFVTEAPELSFQQDGTPYSKQFNDIYFDSESGYQQSEQVFLNGNDISNRIKQESNHFVIGETGFGTGLNFLLTLQTYHKLQQEMAHKKCPKLSFISVEKFPLTKKQLAKSLQALPQLRYFADLLLTQYPEQEYLDEKVKDFSISFFDDQVTLKVIIDDAAQGLSNIHSPKNSLVDAWYLDGFSPAKNPEMWSEELFEQIGRLSKPQASIATFTVAGFVKRQMQKVGFRTQKKAYIGNKHEMLTGIFQQNPNSYKGYQLRSIITKPQHVSVIGGGIASACAALALTKQGIKVTIYCKDNSLAQGASSNAIGALYPLLHQQADDISLFYQQAFWRAKEVYNNVIEQGFHFPHKWCGLLEVAYKESLVKRQQKFNELGTWTKDLIHGVDASKASELANIDLVHGGLFMPNAGWLSPQDAVKQIINAAKLTGRLRVENNTLVTKINKNKTNTSNENTSKNSHQKNWQLITNKGEFDASVVVFCGGAEIIDFDWINLLPFSSVQGQVTSMRTNENISKLSAVVCHKGYLTPSHKNVHCIGATFNKNSTRTTAKPEEDQFNINMLSTCLPELTDKIDWTTHDIASSKSRLRCMTPDHMPMVGAMPDIQKHIDTYPHLAKDKKWKYNQTAPVIDNLYVMMGFGARGLCSAPLAADILTADLCGTPYPVDNNMLFNLSPNRFVIRDIVRRKTPL